MEQPRYHINVYWSEEDECWLADVPDLPFCSAHGSTPAEALSEVQVAMALHLDVLSAEGKPHPQPRYRAPVAELVPA